MRSIQLQFIINGDFDQVVMGLMDPAHGPFVHSCWWWPRRKLREKSKTFEPIPNGFRMRAIHTQHTGPYRLLGGTITTTLDFELPSIRTECIEAGPNWFVTRSMVTQIENGKNRLDVMLCWSILSWLPIERLVALMAKKFIMQDVRVIELLRADSSWMFVGDADEPARWYMQLKKGTQPLNRPVTLRWRS